MDHDDLDGFEPDRHPVVARLWRNHDRLRLPRSLGITEALGFAHALLLLQAVMAERDAAIAEARASDERYRAFVANSSEAIWRYELEPTPDGGTRVTETFALEEGGKAIAKMAARQAIGKLVVTL